MWKVSCGMTPPLPWRDKAALPGPGDRGRPAGAMAFRGGVRPSQAARGLWSDWCGQCCVASPLHQYPNVASGRQIGSLALLNACAEPSDADWVPPRSHETRADPSRTGWETRRIVAQHPFADPPASKAFIQSTRNSNLGRGGCSKRVWTVNQQSPRPGFSFNQMASALRVID